MINQNHNTVEVLDVFDTPLFRCIGCDGWTSAVDEVCECCEEKGISRDLIMMEQEFADAQADCGADDDAEDFDYDAQDEQDYYAEYGHTQRDF